MEFTRNRRPLWAADDSWQADLAPVSSYGVLP